MTKYAQDCTDNVSDLKASIARLGAAIDDNQSKINAANAKVEQRRLKIGEVDTELALAERDRKQFKGIREREQTEFHKTSLDYQDSITAIRKATEVLKAKQVQPEAALMQLNEESSPVEVMSAVSSFLQVAAKQTPVQGSSYKQGSALDGVITMLNELGKKFQQNLHAATVKNTEALSAYENLIASLNQQRDDSFNRKKNLNKEIKDQLNFGKARAELLASNQQDNGQTKADLKETKNICSQTNAVYSKNNECLLGEIHALDQALDILGGDAVSKANKSGNYHKTEEDAPAEGGDETPSFLQLRNVDNKQAVVSFLAERSRKFNSKTLSALSLRVQANPFKKILSMIRDMISKLQKQAVEEANFHGWCQGKLKATTIERDAKKEEVEDNTANLEVNTAKKTKLEGEIAALDEEIKTLKGYMSNGAETRATNKAENEKVILESQEGQAAVENAINILKEFYESAASAAANTGSGNPDANTDVYGASQDKGAGIINIMEVIGSDFSRTESNTKATETKQEELWVEFRNNGEVTLATKQTTKGLNEALLVDTKKEVNRLTTLLAENTELLKQISAQLGEYQKQCKPQVSYEERVEMRENEIQSLKEALGLLRGTPAEASTKPEEIPS